MMGRMKIGIDNYCYHRFFGEVYPGQEPPAKEWSMDDFLARAKALQVDGVSLESCFFPSFDDGYMNELKSKLDDYNFDRVYAWGHPLGLERGQNEEAFKDMCESIRRAKLIGADVIRVCASSAAFINEPHEPQIKALIAQFKQAVKFADEHDVKIAIENHGDYNVAEMLQIIEEVGHPKLGINFDTGNFVRLLDDPVEGMEKLASYVFATHIKDVMVNPAVSPDEWCYFASVPVGEGRVDNLKMAEMLKKANYQGFLAVEIDMPYPDWTNREDEAVSISIENLRKIVDEIS